jgi:hypothetical protein
MAYVDVFNGDADGICALHQLRLSNPVESVLVTGVKRDISLLKRVKGGPGDEVTVLDISLDKNRDGLNRLLERGARIHYIDHHFPGEIPRHANLSATIDPASDTCTSLLVDQQLDGRYRAWAVTAAFGDNLDESARRAAEPLDLNPSELEQLRELGICINYNAYGATLDDLYFSPDGLFRRLHPYPDPFEFITDDDVFKRLRDGYAEDMSKTHALKSAFESESYALYVLPAEAWARRVSGVLGNRLAHDSPNRAHAVLTRLQDGGYVVSVRAPLSNKTGADELCRQFPTGGGRKAAAGINNLPDDLYDEFASRFKKIFA